MKDIKKLQNELKEFNNKSVTIRTDGSIRFAIEIKNVQCIVTNKVVVIGDTELERNKEIEINVDEINQIQICSEIIFEMNGNYNIYISK